jgi:hypothetical protein
MDVVMYDIDPFVYFSLSNLNQDLVLSQGIGKSTAKRVLQKYVRNGRMELLQGCIRLTAVENTCLCFDKWTVKASAHALSFSARCMKRSDTNSSISREMVSVG